MQLNALLGFSISIAFFYDCNAKLISIVLDIEYPSIFLLCKSITEAR